jgi:hypothetical protein
MAQTLLDMTQEILSAMSSDEVNSIGDTTESMQVATIIKRKYFDIVGRAGLPEHEQIINLTPSNDLDMPTLMFVPDEVNRIDWIKYLDTSVVDSNDYKYVTILPTQQFLDMINSFNPNEAYIGSFVFSDEANQFPGTFTAYFMNDRQPSFCTIIGNKYVIFDSYDSTVDDTLQSSKTMCFGQVAPSFRMEDTFIPRLDDKEFPLLLNEAKALAFYELKQMPHAKAEQEIKRQWSSTAKNKSVDNKPSYFDQLPNFARRGGTAWGNRRWWDGR